MASTARSIAAGHVSSSTHPPSNRKTNAAGALVVEALPGEGSAELRLDRGALCVEEVEKGFVVRRDRIVDVQLRASFILEHSVVPPLAVTSRPQPAVPVGGDSGVEVRLLIGVREQGRPDSMPTRRAAAPWPAMGQAAPSRSRYPIGPGLSTAASRHRRRH